MALTTIPVELVTLDDGVTITVDDNSDNLTLTSTDADANAGPNLRLYRNSSSPADSDSLGLIEFEGRNDNSQDVVYAALDARIVDASDGTEDGRIELTTVLAGTAGISRLFMDGTETVFNDNSQDLNFRVESDNNANMLFVDAGNNSVLVGHNTDISVAGESHELQVYDTNFSTISAATFRNGSDGASISLGHSRSGTIGTQTVLQDGDTMGAINFLGSDGTDMASYGARIYVEVDGTPGSNDMPGRIKFATTADGANGSTDRMIIDSSGNVGIGATPSSNSGWNRYLSIKGGSSDAIVLDGTDSQEGAIGAVDGLYIDVTGHTTATNNKIIFRTQSANSNVNGIQRMQLQHDGALRIGGDSFGNITGGMNYVTLADDATKTIALSGTATAGGALMVIYEGASGDNALFHVGYGNCSIVSADSTYATSDTDGKFCVIVSGHNISFKNRIGNSRNFNIMVYGAGNFNYNL